MSLITKFFCFLGGANLSILKDLPSEKNKFIAIGIGVFNTALLSVFTMGYAIKSVINSEIESPFFYILFSLFWGFIILGIDWGLITTMKKRSKYSGWQIFETFATTIFRLAIAVVISFTVSKPLEVMVMKEFLPLARRDAQLNFKKELNADDVTKVEKANASLQNQEAKVLDWINNGENNLKTKDYTLNKLSDDKRSIESRISEFEKRKNHEDKLSNKRIADAQQYINSFQKQINQKNNDIELINNQIKELNNVESLDASKKDKLFNLNSQKTAINNEVISIKSSQSKYIAIRNTERQNKRNRSKHLSRLNAQLSNVNSDISSRNLTIEQQAKKVLDSLQVAKRTVELKTDTIRKKAEVEFKKNEKATDVFDKDNLINNLIAVGYLQKWINDSNSDQGKIEISKKAKQVSILLMILLIIVDIAPILIKLMMPYGPYDQIKENMEKKKQAESILQYAAFQKKYPEIAEVKAKEKVFKTELEIIKSSYQETTKYSSDLQNIQTFNRERIEKEMLKTKDESERKVLGELKTKSWGAFRNAFDNVFEALNAYLKNIKK